MEDEFHILFQCPLYDELRESLYRHACSYEEPFDTYDQTAEYAFLFSCPHLINVCAKNFSNVGHYVNVSVLIPFSQKTSVFTLIIVSSP